MQADWSVACGADDPTVVIPWNDATGALRYIDLRTTPAAIDQIPEAMQYPTLAAALRRWNQPDVPIFTAKCDVWNYATDLFDAYDLPDFAHAQGSYIDLVPIDPALFSNFAACEQQLKMWTARAKSIALVESRCEWTLRAARIFPSSGPASSLPKDGFATTLYVWGYGPTPETAAAAWNDALRALIEPVLQGMHVEDRSNM